jgi:hypothetical protein
MKFTRRPDLDPPTRIHIVMLAWLHQGVYGKMTEIARSYQISRTFLYQLLFMANLQLETLFSDEKCLVQADSGPLEPLILLLRLEGKCSLGSIASILQALEYSPHSVGYLSQFFQKYGHALPSTLSTGSPKVVFYLSDEIFALQAPILITIDAHSTAILRIELAGDRSAETWGAHFAALEDHDFYPLGMASDRGQGLVAGYQAAFETGVWVSDNFHEFRALYQRLHQWERKAYAAMGKEYEAAHKFDHARSESQLAKRLRQYEEAQQPSQRAIARYDHLALLLHLLQETLYLCSPEGKLRTADGVRAELTELFTWMEEMNDPTLIGTLKSLRPHLDDLVVPFEQVEAIQAELQSRVLSPALDFLVLAWHHDHLVYQTRSRPKRYHQHQSEERLAVAQGLLGEAFESLKTFVFDRLDAVIRASSLVEMVNSLVRPYLHSCKGQITQESLNLIMFYHNHHRYQRGRRKGKAPLELLTGQPLPGEWWELLIQQVQEAEKAPDAVDRPTKPPLHLWVNPEGATELPTRSDRPASGPPRGASEPDLRPADAQAA